METHEQESLSVAERELLRQLEKKAYAEQQASMARRVMEEKERCVALVEEVATLAVGLAGDEIALAVLKLHMPDVDGYGNAGCEGCECSCSSEWGRSAADWPCATWTLIESMLRAR